jgi:hypothetical protein
MKKGRSGRTIALPLPTRSVGGNVELHPLVNDPALEYRRKVFRFALLEARPAATADEVFLAREAIWKRILLTRGDFGLNRN